MFTCVLFLFLLYFLLGPLWSNCDAVSYRLARLKTVQFLGLQARRNSLSLGVKQCIPTFVALCLHFEFYSCIDHFTMLLFKSWPVCPKTALHAFTVFSLKVQSLFQSRWIFSVSDTKRLCCKIVSVLDFVPYSCMVSYYLALKIYLRDMQLLPCLTFHH